MAPPSPPNPQVLFIWRPLTFNSHINLFSWLFSSWKGYKMGKRERKCEEEIEVEKGGDDLEGGEEPREDCEGGEKGGKVR